MPTYNYRDVKNDETSLTDIDSNVAYFMSIDGRKGMPLAPLTFVHEQPPLGGGDCVDDVDAKVVLAHDLEPTAGFIRAISPKGACSASSALPTLSA